MMTTKTYPAHYTQADIAQIERAQAWMTDRNFSQAALARLSRVAASTLNQILHGGYITSPSKQLASIESAMRHADETTSDTASPVETSVFKLAQTACMMARRYRNFAVLSCWVGTGKTFAVKHYAKTHPNTHLIEADPTLTQQILVKMLARRVLGVEGKGGMADRFNAVVEALKNTDSLLIIDEAETLTAKQLHLLRRLRDLANVGILLCGTENLTGIIKPEFGQFEQIRSRTGFWPETVRKISAEDAAALIQSGFGTEDVPEEVVKRLYQYSKGSARMLVEGLIAGIKEFRKGRELDVKLVDAVAKQALCLQSIA
jgi:hypothetical protein